MSKPQYKSKLLATVYLLQKRVKIVFVLGLLDRKEADDEQINNMFDFSPLFADEGWVKRKFMDCY